MTSFMAHRSILTTTIHLVAPPDEVFPLFEPLGEKLWEPDWNPVMIYPAMGGTETHAVFTTQLHDGSPAIWVIVQFDPTTYQVTYLRVAPHSHVATIAVHCAREAAGTTIATVTYTFTGLTAHGNAYVDTFSEDYYCAWIQRWEVAINHYLQHTMAPEHHADEPN